MIFLIREGKTAGAEKGKARKVYHWLWLHLRKLISGFIVTMLGVLAAFWLMGYGEQRALDRMTQQRLNLAALEAMHNRREAKDFLIGYLNKKEANIITIQIRRFGSAAGEVAFQDTNILSILSLAKVSMLRSYLNDIDMLNLLIEIRRGLLESQGYKAIPQQEEPLNKNIRERVAKLYAKTLFLDEEIFKHFEKTSSDIIESRKLNVLLKLKEEDVIKDFISKGYLEQADFLEGRAK